LFDPLSDQSEELPLDQFIFDLESTYANPLIVHFIIHNIRGITQEKVKFSVLYRAYLLDALAEINAGAEMYPTLYKHHNKWREMVVHARQLRKS
jgi:hypothetical protein